MIDGGFFEEYFHQPNVARLSALLTPPSLLDSGIAKLLMFKIQVNDCIYAFNDPPHVLNNVMISWLARFEEKVFIHL